ERQLAANMESRKRLISVELLGQRFTRLLEPREVGGSPPVAQCSGGVERGAIIVEAVTDLVADDRSDRAIIEGRVGIGVEERLLQDSGGEVERVLDREVDRVHGLRSHPPFLAV